MRVLSDAADLMFTSLAFCRILALMNCWLLVFMLPICTAGLFCTLGIADSVRLVDLVILVPASDVAFRVVSLATSPVLLLTASSGLVVAQADTNKIQLASSAEQIMLDILLFMM